MSKDSGVRGFFKPGWVIAAVVAVIFSSACFLVLAPWQLGKNTSTEHRNDLVRAAADTPAVPIDQLAPATKPLNLDVEWREVSVTGTYRPDQQVLLRLRSGPDSRPVTEVVTPFAVAGTDRLILVDRGYIAQDAVTSRSGGKASTDVPATPDGQVTISGRLRETEQTSPGKEPRRDGDQLTAYTIDTTKIGGASGLALDPFYLQLSDQQPGVLNPIGLPQLESGPYLSYGLQWLAFGVMAPLGVIYFVYSEVKHRKALKERAAGKPEELPDDDSRAAEKRRIRDELRDASAPGTAEKRADVGIGAGVAPDVADDDDVSAKLARRYGR